MGAPGPAIPQPDFWQQGSRSAQSPAADQKKQVVPGMGPPHPVSQGHASLPPLALRARSFPSLLCSAADVISHGSCTPWWVLRSASPEVRCCTISTQLLGRDLHTSLQCLPLPWKEAPSYDTLRLDTVKQQMFTAEQNICIKQITSGHNWWRATLWVF